MLQVSKLEQKWVDHFVVNQKQNKDIKNKRSTKERSRFVLKPSHTSLQRPVVYIFSEP